MNQGRIKILQTQAELDAITGEKTVFKTDGVDQGAFVDSIVYLVADNLTVDTAEAVMLHEGFA